MKETPQRVFVTHWGLYVPASVRETHQQVVGGLWSWSRRGRRSGVGRWERNPPMSHSDSLGVKWASVHKKNLPTGCWWVGGLALWVEGRGRGVEVVGEVWR